MPRLAGKIAWITGAGSGIGEAAALALAEEGATTVLTGRRREPLEGVAARIHQQGGTAHVQPADLTNSKQVQKIGEFIRDTLGRLDILVNNAGISGSSVGDEDGLEGWQKLLAVNATSVFLGTKLAAAEMAKTGGGSIVNISSIMGIVASEDSHPGYPASKAAVRNYTKAAACRYGPQGVRVNSVHPGYMPPMLNATNAAGRAAKIAQTPLRRLGEPIEVAYGVLFLASDEASFVTGTELVIDGGFIAH
jgi:NAD(P)-dependent dehydrogenase (short-subunit alcohol dehydrogenase family)